MSTAVAVVEKLEERAEAVYGRLRSQLEVDANIGQMVIIDPESGDFEVDKLGVAASRRLRRRHPDGEFFGIRIGFEAAESFGGIMARREE